MKSFLVSTQSDLKQRRLEAVYPQDGYYVWMKLLTEIYQTEGYYMPATSADIEAFAGSINRNHKLVKKIIRACSEFGLLDKQQLEQNQILTSSAIQKQYLDYYKRSKSKSVIKDSFKCVQDEEIVNKNQKNDAKNENLHTNSLPISYHHITLHNIPFDDDDSVNLKKLETKLATEIQRTDEAYQEASQSMRILELIIEACNSIEDINVIHGINNASETKLGELWYKALSYIEDDVFLGKAPIINKVAYMKKTIENTFKNYEKEDYGN